LPIKTATHKVFEKSCHLNQLLLFIDYRPDKVQNNVENLNDIDITRLECNVDLLSINSWNEIVCDSKQGRLLEALLGIYMQPLKSGQINVKTDIFCNHPNRFFQQRIRQTLNLLFKEVFNFFQHNPSGRYISYINGRYLVLHTHEQRSIIKWLSTEYELKSLLHSSVPYYSPIGFDANTMSHHPLVMFSQQHSPESIQVFFRLRGKQVDITLIDELGAWYEATLSYFQGKASLQSLHRFLRAVNERRHDQAENDIGPFDIFPISFSEVICAHEGLQLERCSISSQVDGRAGLPIYAVAECVEGQYFFTLYVDENHFSEVDEGDEAYRKLAILIKREWAQRQSINHYYINDMDLSKCRLQLSYSGELNTSHYLIMKAKVEGKINQALAIKK
jgi:adenylate cyclase class 1